MSKDVKKLIDHLLLEYKSELDEEFSTAIKEIKNIAKQAENES